MKQTMTTKKLAQTAMLVAMATAVHWLEGVLVPLFPGLPGVKLGWQTYLRCMRCKRWGDLLRFSSLFCGVG